MTAKTERTDAIRWIQTQMDDYGLTLEELDAGGASRRRPRHQPHRRRRRSAIATRKG